MNRIVTLMPRTAAREAGEVIKRLVQMLSPDVGKHITLLSIADNFYWSYCQSWCLHLQRQHIAPGLRIQVSILTFTGVLHHLLSLRQCNTSRAAYRPGNKITISLMLYHCNCLLCYFGGTQPPPPPPPPPPPTYLSSQHNYGLCRFFSADMVSSLLFFILDQLIVIYSIIHHDVSAETTSAFLR